MAGQPGPPGRPTCDRSGKPCESANGDAITGLAVDLFASVTIDRFVSQKPDHAVGAEAIDHEAGDDPGEPLRAPPTMRTIGDKWTD